MEPTSLRARHSIHSQKKVGNQAFELWLRQRLSPAPALEFRSVAHPDGEIVLLEIPAATMMPTSFESVQYIRIGNATPKLSDDPGRYQAIIEKMRPYTWEHGIAASYLTTDDVLQLFDYRSYFSLTDQRSPTDSDHILHKLAGDRLVKEDVGGRWNITNLGAILFASDLKKIDQSLERKAVRIVCYDGVDRTATVKLRRDAGKAMHPALKVFCRTSITGFPAMNISGKPFAKSTRCFLHLQSVNLWRTP